VSLPVCPDCAEDINLVAQGVFLYGVLGPGAEQHLASLLETRPDKAVQVLKILAWLGTMQSVPAVARAIEAHPDQETVRRGVAFLLTVGAPAGREAILKLDHGRLDAAARNYVERLEAGVVTTTFAFLVESLGGPGPALSDVEVRRRLDVMVQSGRLD